MSRTDFHDGDSIVIEEVRGTHDSIVAGGTYRVRGRYTLASAEKAHLALTSTGGRTSGNHKEMDVERGTGAFDYTFTQVEIGYPHLWMAAVEGGSSFCDLWFGTGPETCFLPEWEHQGFWGPEPAGATAPASGDPAMPVPFGAVPHGFSGGDEVAIKVFRGTSARIEAEGDYILQGAYSLFSRDAADLFLVIKPAGGGDDRTLSHQMISRGNGTFSLSFRTETPGELALLLEPPNGGDSIGAVSIKVFNPAPADTKSTGWVDRGDTGFAFEGDGITIEAVSGPQGPFAIGSEYVVRGAYTLASHPKAYLAVYCMNGDLDGEHGMEVERGKGTFEFKFRIVKPGKPHVSFYPADEGYGFGNVLFESDGSVVR